MALFRFSWLVLSTILLVSSVSLAGRTPINFCKSAITAMANRKALQPKAFEPALFETDPFKVEINVPSLRSSLWDFLKGKRQAFEDRSRLEAEKQVNLDRRRILETWRKEAISMLEAARKPLLMLPYGAADFKLAILIDFGARASAIKKNLNHSEIGWITAEFLNKTEDVLAFIKIKESELDQLRQRLRLQNTVRSGTRWNQWVKLHQDEVDHFILDAHFWTESDRKKLETDYTDLFQRVSKLGVNYDLALVQWQNREFRASQIPNTVGVGIHHDTKRAVDQFMRLLDLIRFSIPQEERKGIWPEDFTPDSYARQLLENSTAYQKLARVVIRETQELRRLLQVEKDKETTVKVQVLKPQFKAYAKLRVQHLFIVLFRKQNDSEASPDRWFPERVDWNHTRLRRLQESRALVREIFHKKSLATVLGMPNLGDKKLTLEQAENMAFDIYKYESLGWVLTTLRLSPPELKTISSESIPTRSENPSNPFSVQSLNGTSDRGRVGGKPNAQHLLDQSLAEFRSYWARKFEEAEVTRQHISLLAQFNIDQIRARKALLYYILTELKDEELLSAPEATFAVASMIEAAKTHYQTQENRLIRQEDSLTNRRNSQISGFIRRKSVSTSSNASVSTTNSNSPIWWYDFIYYYYPEWLFYRDYSLYMIQAVVDRQTDLTPSVSNYINHETYELFNLQSNGEKPSVLNLPQPPVLEGSDFGASKDGILDWENEIRSAEAFGMVDLGFASSTKFNDELKVYDRLDPQNLENDMQSELARLDEAMELARVESELGVDEQVKNGGSTEFRVTDPDKWTPSAASKIEPEALTSFSTPPPASTSYSLPDETNYSQPSESYSAPSDSPPSTGD